MADKKIKILLAEDDSFIQKAYKDGFERKNFDVLVAGDGEVAINLMKSNKPDIVLLDLIMPKKNGFDVLKEMKSDEDLKNIPVIVLSNLGQDSDVDKCKTMGAVDYLIKSDYSIPEILEKIKEHI